MFKKRRVFAAAPESSPPASTAPTYSPLSSAGSPQNPPSTSAAPPSASTLLDANVPNPEQCPISPLRMDFDFDLPAPAFGKDIARPQTSDGIISPRSSSLPSAKPNAKSNQTQFSSGLPAIQLAASKRDRIAMGKAQEESSKELDTGKGKAKQEHILPDTDPPFTLDFGDGVDVSLFPRPGTSSSTSPALRLQDARPATSGGDGSSPKMESSLFPTRAPMPALPSLDTNAPMSRAWIDARDKPYAAPPARPQLQTANSSPDLRAAARTPTAATSTLNPVSTPSNNTTPRPSPLQSFSTGNMNTLARPPSNTATNYSGTTARSMQSSKSTAVGSDVLIRTIGTPYGETSSSFPLPQHVATRPKTAGAMANIRGVDVPTHHTSALKPPRPTPPAKPEKRKTKLLNPMNLLTRRKSGQDDEALATERAAQEQALQRQKNVAALGVSRLPEDFDPRIKGKGVHDFSAPRQSRQSSQYNNAAGFWSQASERARSRGLQTSNSSPFIPTGQDEEGSPWRVSESSPRRSLHTPVFKEHLTENATSADAAGVQAERLENKAFLNRVSQVSQESGVLPPFARKSHQIDGAMQSSLLNRDASPEPSGSASKEIDQRISSSSSGISPVTQRNSVLPGGIDHSRQSISPVSPATPDKTGTQPFSRTVSRPVSEVSRLGSSDGMKNHRMSEVSRFGQFDTTRPVSSLSSSSDPVDASPSDANNRHVSVQPQFSPIVEEFTPKLGDGFTPLPERSQGTVPDVVVARGDELDPSLDSSAMNSTQLTPEIEHPEAGLGLETPPKLVQKRASAVGHARRSSSNAAPKHHTSNASRFSFQLGGGSAMEEKALEEKARKLTTAESEAAPKIDYDDEDYFDEDAMDDMDEIEVQAQQHEGLGISDDIQMMGFPMHNGIEAQYLPPIIPMSQARQALQLGDDSDSASESESEIETPSWKASTGIHKPRTSDETKLTLNTNLDPNGNGFLQDEFNSNGNTRSGFYMQPQAAGYSPTLTQRAISPPQSKDRPALPHRDSGNSERNRILSGLQAGTNGDGFAHGHTSKLSDATDASADEMRVSSLNGDAVAGAESGEHAGLGLSGFSAFKFTESPSASRPLSLEPVPRQRPLGADRSRGDSETLPQGATFGDNIPVAVAADRNIASAQDRLDANQYDLDDMYFDDGGFEPDVNDRSYIGEAVDEDAFDDDDFLRKPNGVGHAVQPVSQNGNDTFRLSSPSLGGADGPYPSFAMPRSNKPRVRDSQVLLEDLPLYEQPFDPRWVPRRNPSEDARMLGVGKTGPPLPPQGTSASAAARLQANLQTYHAALADAANKAAVDGRFSRRPSNSTSGESGVSKADVEDNEMPSRDGPSLDSLNGYEDDEDETEPTLTVNSLLPPADPNAVMDSASQQALLYGVPQMNFDFGFDTAPMDDAIMDSDFDVSGDDDDIVAAANAEALANDDDGFYGQEFGFYAKARPNSLEIEAINGGFFGLDGDDSIARQRSLKEPNLTPITERSEFSTRNSFIGLGMGQFGPPSAGPFSPGLARLPVSPLAMDGEITTFDQLRRLKANAFGGGSNISLHSDSSGGGIQMHSSNSAPVSARGSATTLQTPQGYFGSIPTGSAPMTFAYSTDSSNSSNPSSAHPHTHIAIHESPVSAASSSHLPFSMDPDATPKRPSTAVDTPMTTRRVSDKPTGARGHSRNSSGADSVTYVREQDPDGNGPPRWVLEKRRTSEQGQLELVAREVVQDGWI